MDSKTNTTTTRMSNDPGPEGATESPSLQPESWGVGFGPIRRFFQAIFDITFRPGRFFSSMPPYGNITSPLAFALAVSWMGKAGEFLWKVALSNRVNPLFDPFWRLVGDLANQNRPGNSEVMFQVRDQVTNWMWGTGSILLDPFITLFSVLFISFFVYIGARLLVSPGRPEQPVEKRAPDEIRYETALRIVCYGKAPLILATIPIAGPFLATILVMISTTIGAREVYRVGWGRASTVAFFPQVLMFGLVLIGFLALGLAMLKLFSGL